MKGIEKEKTASAWRDQLRAEFRTAFGSAAGARLVRAPGRINLIGEHVDYNGGFVLPVAINRHVYVFGKKRPGRKVRILSLDFKQKKEMSLDGLEYSKDQRWVNYPAGVFQVLQNAGYHLEGMDLVVTGNIPMGANLSSSAAFETASAFIAKILNDQNINAVTMAKLCQQAENRFVGVNCGIMDQFASCLGKAGNALLIDCQSLEYELIKLELKDFVLVICDTKRSRELVKSAYNERRKECEEGLKILQKDLPEIRSLRDVSAEDFKRLKKNLPEPVIRRLEHVINEIARVKKTVECLRRGDMASVGAILVESHRSLAELYEVSCKELEIMEEISLSSPGIIGGRMTGAGFGGCTVNIVRREYLIPFVDRVKEEYLRLTNLHAAVYVCRAVNGVEEIK